MTLCFIHIPKTGGTTFRNVMSDSIGADRVYWIGHERDESEWFSLTAQDLDSFELVGGHTSFASFRHKLPNAVYATVIREPIARAVSFYQFVRGRHQEDAVWADLPLDSLEAAIQNHEAFRREVTNRQCWLLSESDSFASAIASLESAEWMVGTTERLGSLAAAACERFGWKPANMVRSNVSPPGYFDELCTPGAAALLRELNRGDAQLYEHLKVQQP
jgi:hypothetical protein